MQNDYVDVMMNYACRHICTLFIVLIFAAKLTIPVFIEHKNLLLQEQEFKSQGSEGEPDAEKFSVSAKTEIANLHSLNYSFNLFQHNIPGYYKIAKHHPVEQFSAVLTPPPWFRM